MRKIADTAALQSELRRLLSYAESSRPSRILLARDLRSLGERVAGTLPKMAGRTFRPGTATHFEAEAKKLFHGQPVKIDLNFEPSHRKDGDSKAYLVITTPSDAWIDETFNKSGDAMLYPFNHLCRQFNVDYRLAGKTIVVGH